MIYIVYECDKHRTHASTCVKEIFTSKQQALSFYNKGVKLFKMQGESEWFLNLATHSPRINLSLDNDVLHDMVLIKSNEDGYKRR
jgi:hypothetical protein